MAELSNQKPETNPVNFHISKYLTYFLSDSSSQCGIPILGWIQVFLLLFLVRSVISFYKLNTIKSDLSCRTNNMIRFVIIDPVLMAWAVFGGYLLGYE
jgi:hypothetical protein